jgi:uncharacterized protein YjbI with pentapeptide repeats
MNKILSGSNKNLFGIFLGLGFLILLAILVKYNSEKSSTKDNMTSPLSTANLSDVYTAGAKPEVQGSATSGTDNYLSVSGINTTMPQANMNHPTVNPTDLLPKDMNSDWASITPASNDLKNLNLLNPNQLIGINTVGSSLRNANLQLRSDPVIPKTSNLGPWNQSTIDNDTMRRPFEIGVD